jgi:hypothetical protein
MFYFAIKYLIIASNKLGGNMAGSQDKKTNFWMPRLILGAVLAFSVALLFLIPGALPALGLASAVALATKALVLPWLLPAFCMLATMAFPFIDHFLAGLNRLLTRPTRLFGDRLRKTDSTIGSFFLGISANLSALLFFPAAVLRVIATMFYVPISYLTTGEHGLKEGDRYIKEAVFFSAGEDETSIKDLFVVRCLRRFFTQDDGTLVDNDGKQAPIPNPEKYRGWVGLPLLLEGLALGGVTYALGYPYYFLTSAVIAIGLIPAWLLHKAANLAERGMETDKPDLVIGFSGICWFISESLSRMLSIPSTLVAFICASFIETANRPDQLFLTSDYVGEIEKYRTWRDEVPGDVQPKGTTAQPATSSHGTVRNALGDGVQQPEPESVGNSKSVFNPPPLVKQEEATVANSFLHKPT